MMNLKCFLKYLMLSLAFISFDSFSQNDILVCENWELSASVTASNVQWQIFDDMEWSDLEDSPNIMGSQSVNLTLDSVNVSSNGDSLRCLTTSTISGLQDSVLFIASIEVLPELTPSTLFGPEGLNCYEVEMEVGAIPSWEFTYQNLLSADWQILQGVNWMTTGQSDLELFVESNPQSGFELRQQLSVPLAQCPTVISDTLFVTVLPSMTPPIIADQLDGSPICFGSSPGDIEVTTFAAGGSESWVYSWEMLIEGVWNTLGVSGSVYTVPDLEENSTYRCVATDNVCGVVISNEITISVLPAVILPTIGVPSNVTQICYGTDAPIFDVISPVAGANGEWTSNWQISYGEVWSTLGAADMSLSLGAQTSSFTVRIQATSDFGCGTFTSNEITIEVWDDLSAGTIFTSQLICYNSSPNDLFATSATGGDDNFNIQWYSVSETGIETAVGSDVANLSVSPLLDTTYYFVAYSNLCGLVESNTVSINVLPALEEPLLTRNFEGDICFGSELTISASGFNTYPWLSYQWFEHHLDGSILPVGDGQTELTLIDMQESIDVSFEISSSYGCGSIDGLLSDVIVLNDLSAPMLIDVAEGEPICYDTSPGVISFSSDAAGGSESWSYSWGSFINGVWTESIDSGSDYLVPNLTETTSYHVIATDDLCGSILSSTLTISVFDQLLSAQIQSPSDAVLCDVNEGVYCSVMNPATGGGGLYTIQWLIDNGGGWSLLNGESESGLTIESLDASSSIQLQVESDLGCGTVESNEISFVVLPEVISPQIQIPANSVPICYDFSAPSVSLQVDPSGADENWEYDWEISYGQGFYSVSSAQDDLLLGALTESLEVRGKAVSTFGCGTFLSNVISIPVWDVLVPGEASESQLICFNTSPSDLSSTFASGGGDVFEIQWFEVQESNVTNGLGLNSPSLSITQLLDTTEYFVQFTNLNGCGVVESNSITIDVLPDLEVPMLMGDIQGDICFGADFTVNATEIVDYPWLSYQWFQHFEGELPQDIGTDELELALTYLQQSQTIYLDVSSDYGCGTVTGELIDIVVLDSMIAPVIDFSISPLNPICYGDSAPLIEMLSDASGGGETFTTVWMTSTSESLPFAFFEANSAPLALGELEDDIFVLLFASDDYGCGSLESNLVLVEVFEDFTINSQPQSIVICDDEIISGVEITVDGGGGIYSYEWNQMENDIWDVLPLEESNSIQLFYPDSTASYQVNVSSDFGCGTLPSDTIIVTVLPALVAGTLGFSDDVLCQNETLNYASTDASGGTDNFDQIWHQTDLEGSWFNSPTALNGSVENVQYSFSGSIEYVNSCGSIWSDTLSLLVNPIPPSAVLIGDVEICNGSSDVIYSIDIESGPWEFLWDVSNGTITSGETGDEILVDWSEDSASIIYVGVTNTETECYSYNEWDVVLTETSAPAPSVVVKKPLINILVSADSTDCATYQWGRLNIATEEVEFLEGQTDQYAYLPILDTLNYHYFVDIVYDCEGVVSCPTRNYYLHDPYLFVHDFAVAQKPTVYPNPNTGTFQVKVPYPSGWHLMNSNGVVVEYGSAMSSDKINFEIDKSGLYFLQILGDGNHESIKIIVAN
jgi:FlaG/FlaF family flagellin (archaellin)